MLETDRYSIHKWGQGYFDINQNGCVSVRPDRTGQGGDLYELTKSLVQQGIDAPILLRFNGIIHDRIRILSEAFRSAIEEFDYRNCHRMVYPLKVNPQRHVVEIIQKAGQEHLMGLEVGSKPELLAVMAIEQSHEMLLLCNGYKDAEYIRLALMARKLGRRVLVIVEQPYELKLVLHLAEELNVEPEIGFRMKLSQKGSGRWETSSGESAKFGLYSYEIVACSEQLLAEGKGHWVKLLHFHIGSQITSIESIKKALREGTRMYTELALQHPSLSIFDVGGGLAVDYDGSKSITDSSKNYTEEEYARDVVSEIGEACLYAGVPDPIIVTESGRAVVSFMSVLIVEVIDSTSPADIKMNGNLASDKPIILSLKQLNEDLELDNAREVFHDLIEIKEVILQEFLYGHINLKERAYAEQMFRYLLNRVHGYFHSMHEKPEELAAIDQLLREIYFCNFSVFQSLPDSWAIHQLFPIMPIHRLQEEPEREAIIADLSCDSDGKIDCFIGRQKKKTLMLHPYKEEPYFIGIFLVGAYQEILGGLHNLFGDTNVVHAEWDEKANSWDLSRLVEGDTMEEVLRYVQYNKEGLKEQLQGLIENALKHGRITSGEGAEIKRKYKESLENYTYLIV